MTLQLFLNGEKSFAETDNMEPYLKMRLEKNDSNFVFKFIYKIDRDNIINVNQISTKNEIEDIYKDLKNQYQKFPLRK